MAFTSNINDRQRDSFKDVGGDPARMVSIVESVALPITGTVAVSGTIPVSITTNPVPISGTVAVSGTVPVSIAATVLTGNTDLRIGATISGQVVDSIAITYPTTSSEVYTYRVGGVSGSVLATLTLAFSDAVTKNVLTSAVRT